MHLQRLEIARVHAEQIRLARPGGVQLALLVHFEEHRHPQLARELPQRTQRGERRRRGDEQDGVRSMCARLAHLEFRDDEVLAQHR